jgi:ABC-type glutathione transport system ATPase component
VDSGNVLQVTDFSGGFVSAAGELTKVLDGVSFELPASSLTAIVGETGSGKSLMALSILGIPPQGFRRTSGSIVFEGTDLLRQDEKALRSVRGARIAMAFQDARGALNPVLTVGRQISDICRVHQQVGKKEAWARAEQLLGQVQVPEPARRMKQYPHEFSGGMAQRAMICRPALLILDEPTTGLDVTTQADIMDLIVDLKRRDGLSTCLITHDLGVVAETCDYVVVMRDGRIREYGPCEQVLTRPRDPYTAELINASRLVESAA